ncbi:MAG: TIGR00730 family Rossman fold protein [Terriglobales bacterium]
MKAVCVFCGSSSGIDPAYSEAAQATGSTLARAGLRLIYGGGRVGLMGSLADAALAAGGQVVGVIPRALAESEISHQGLSELHLVETMHERKARMAQLADAFIALPGGAGTLEEIFEQWTWAQLGVHNKPCGFLNVKGYFDPLLEMIRRMTAQQFMRPEYASMLVVETEPERLLAQFAAYRPPTRKWLGRGTLAVEA